MEIRGCYIAEHLNSVTKNFPNASKQHMTTAMNWSLHQSSKTQAGSSTLQIMSPLHLWKQDDESTFSVSRTTKLCSVIKNGAAFPTENFSHREKKFVYYFLKPHYYGLTNLHTIGFGIGAARMRFREIQSRYALRHVNGLLTGRQTSSFTLQQALFDQLAGRRRTGVMVAPMFALRQRSVILK
uniref:Uncharacterized protein n=1 Tax=Romanomermis culicivorax TaxID=13658 RepID=A0A915IEG1_ROMCU